MFCILHRWVVSERWRWWTAYRCTKCGKRRLTSEVNP